MDQVTQRPVESPTIPVEEHEDSAGDQHDKENKNTIHPPRPLNPSAQNYSIKSFQHEFYICPQAYPKNGYVPPELRKTEYKGPQQIEQPRSFPKNFGWPVDLTLAKNMRGQRSLQGPPKDHHFGLDISYGGSQKIPVVAAADGEVLVAEDQLNSDTQGNPFKGGSGFGKLVVLDHGKGWRTFYAHLASIEIEESTSKELLQGRRKKIAVKKGQRIGIMGTTGQSTGVHLHYEVKFYCEHYDPRRFLPASPTAKQIGFQNPDLFIWP